MMDGCNTNGDIIRTYIIDDYSDNLAFSCSTGTMWHIPSGTTLGVCPDHQYFIYGDMLIEGELQLSGNSQLVVLNGNINLSGGTITGTGNAYNIFLPLTDTKISGLTYDGSVLTIYQTDGTNFSANIAFTGNTSGSCITNLYVQNLNSCSPLHIQPINNGDVYISESGGNVGIGTTNPLSTLDVNGKITTTNFQMTSGSTNGYILTSDASGNAYWTPPFVDTYVTGFTYDNFNNLTISQNQGQPDLTVTLPPYITGYTDYYVTGGTYSNGTLTLERQDSSFTIPGFLSADTYVTGFTYDNFNNLTISQNQGQPDLVVNIDVMSGLTINGSLSATTYLGLPIDPDNYITGGTYSNGTLTLDRQNGSVSISGFLSADTYVTGFTYDSYNLTISQNEGQPDLTVTLPPYITGFTDYYVTGGTYSNGTLTLERQDYSFTIPGFLTGTTDTYITGFTYLNNNLTISQNESQPDLVVNISSMTGLTIDGSFSATTYLGLPIDPDNYVTGGTYSNGTLTLDRQNGSVSISGFLSADTYVTGFTFNTGTYDLTILQNNGLPSLTQNLGILAGDITVTGGTYNPSNGVATFYNNIGGSFQVSGFLTGFTDTYLASGSFNPNNGDLTLTRTDNVNVVVTGFTDYYVTGGTYSNDTLTLNRQNGSVIITGLTSSDTYTTGFTYSNNNLSILQNQGQSPLNVNISNMSGLTINGNLSTTSISPIDYIDFNVNPTIPSATGGTLYFDYNENALSYKPITNQNDVTVNIGQESLIRIYNQTGVQINNGQVLHITGATSGIPTVALANASILGVTFTESLAQSSGVATHNIPNGEYGFMTNFGIVRDLNTSGFTVGQELFLSDTIDGGITNDPNSIAFTSRISTLGWCLSSDPVNGKIYVKIENENPLQSLTQQEINILLGNTISTGAYSYTGMTKASSTTVNVSPMRGWIVYNTYEYSLNPLVLNIYYSGGTNIPVTSINSSLDTYFLVNSGGTLYQQTSFPTPEERRNNIFLGRAVHPNKTDILNVEQTVDYDVSPMSSLRDLWTPIKLINQGVIPSSNGANLQFKTSSGTFWGNGIGWDTNELDPNSIIVPPYSPAVFYYTTQTGGSFTVTANTIDTTKYDVNGIITNVPGSGNYTTQRIYMSQSGIIRIQYAQNYYSTLAKAIAEIPSETFIENSDNGIDCILIGLLTVKDGTGDLSNTDDAVFTLVSKFGEILGGTAGISTTTLQQAYNNSTNPEIVTNITEGGVQFKGGTGSDTDKNIIIENNSGVVTGYWRADGLLSATTFYGSGVGLVNIPISGVTNLQSSLDSKFDVTGGTITNNINVLGSVSATTFYGDGQYLTGLVTNDFYVTGGTFSADTLTLNRQNGSVTITGFTSGGETFTGGTINGFTTFTNGLSANTITADSFSGDGSSLTNITSTNVSSKLFNYYNFI